ncbi:MAG: OpgC domain-containing protein [Dongiaceae bacterium]
MKRYDIIDGFRGYFLVFMLVNHLPFTGSSWIVHVNHGELGFMEDVQGFIFISGLVVGLTHARGYLSGKAAVTDSRIFARARLLYVYSLALLALLFGAAMILPNADLYWHAAFPAFFQDRSMAGLASLLLLYQPNYLDILPQYIFYLLLSPWLIRLVLDGKHLQVMVASILVWFAVQFGLHLPVVAGVETAGRVLDPHFALLSGFNPLAWQILFVAGLIIGIRLNQGSLDLDQLFGPARRQIFKLALGISLVFMVCRLGIKYHFLPEMIAMRLQPYINRNEFGPIYLLNFVAAGYVVTWLLIAGRDDQATFIRMAHRVLGAIFKLKFLRFLGQHSLQVYAYHVVLIYLVMALDRLGGPFTEWSKTTITLAGVASLIIPAWLHANRHILSAPLSVRKARPAE